MNTVELLKAAKAKIENPEMWAKGFYAYDAEGEMTDATAPNAVCFCSVGALEAASGKGVYTPGFPMVAYDFLAAAVDDHVPNFNDEHTHAEVMAAWDRAIAAAEAANH